MRIVDLVLTLPPLAVAAVLGQRPGRRHAGGCSRWCSAFLAWADVARVVRGVVLSLREQEFVEAARALGASDRRIIFRHLLPNALGPIIVNATIAGGDRDPARDGAVLPRLRRPAARTPRSAC